MAVTENETDVADKVARGAAYMLAIANGVWWLIVGGVTIYATLTMGGHNPPGEVVLFAVLPVAGFGLSVAVLVLAAGNASVQRALLAALLLSTGTVVATMAFYLFQIIMIFMVLVMMLAGG
jgi:hypothetical protein